MSLVRIRPQAPLLPPLERETARSKERALSFALAECEQLFGGPGKRRLEMFSATSVQFYALRCKIFARAGCELARFGGSVSVQRNIDAKSGANHVPRTGFALDA